MLLLWCDIIVILSLLIYATWFIRNAQTRFKHESTENLSVCLKNAYFLKRDWCKGAVLFKGYHHLFQGCTLIFSIMVLFNMAYGDNTITRIVIYTCLSLIASMADITLKFGEISNCFRNAYYIINSAIMKYETGKINESELCDAIDAGEDVVKLINLF